MEELPDEVVALLDGVQAPRQLRHHLRVVHDVAARLVVLVACVDGELVRFGAATHDIGKSIYIEELNVPGKAHEVAGRALLLERGVSPARARFAWTHGRASDDPELMLEDLVVRAADKLWRGVRDVVLEERIARAVTARTEGEFWEVWARLDEGFESLAADGARRLVRSRQGA